jgi:LuxR family maltose regulon positive regulatory protein
MVVGDGEEFRRLPETIEVYRAALALGGGDGLGAVRHAQRALDLAPPDDHVSRAAALGLCGLAYWGSGDLEAGYGAYADCMAGLLRAGFVSDTFGCAMALADIRIAQGRLGDAMRVYEQALNHAPDRQVAVLRGTADMYVGMSRLHREHGDLHTANEDLLRSEELGEQGGLPQNLYRWRVAMARIREAEDDIGGALGLLDEAERLYVSDYFPNVRPISALRARVWITQGQLGQALGWARERALTPDDDLSYEREFEHLTLARLLLARQKVEHDEVSLDEVARFLRRLLSAAEDGRRAGSVIEILMLLALADQARGDIPEALTSLKDALTLAEPEGYVRLFVDEGPPMALLLRAAMKQGISPGYVRRLLAAAAKTAGSATANQGLIEQLSEREREVLRLLGTDLDGPGIARTLVVSLNTVRTHTSHIYAKLGVNNRRAAIRQAEELDLLSRRE